MVLTILTARINPCVANLVEERLVDDPPEPRRIEAAQVYTGDDRATVPIYELPHQVGGRLAPERLFVFESFGSDRSSYHARTSAR